jgi:cell division septation protein DedD
MSNPNVSWDIQDQNDRIISILAWVVVVVLVLYACVYFYKQARGVAERPTGRTPDARLASGGNVGAPPVTGALRPTNAVAPELTVPGDNTRVVSHRPVVRPSPASEPLARVPLSTDPAVSVGTPPTSSAGYAVRIGKPHGSPQEAQKELFKLPVVVQDINFVQEGASWVLQVGKYKTLEEAKAFVKRIQPHISSAEIVALDAAPAAAPAPVRTAEAKPARVERRPAAKPAAADEPAPRARAAKPAPRAKPEPVARTTGAEKRGRTRPERKPAKPVEVALATTDESETETETAVAGDAAALAPDARALARGAGERGVLGAVTTGDEDEQPVRARRKITIAEPDEDGEIDAAPRRRRAVADEEESEEPVVEGTSNRGLVASSATARARSATSVAAELQDAAADRGPAGHYSLQVGAFASEDKARAVAGQLRSNGVSARVDEAVTGESTIYRVRVGKYANNREAQTEKRRIAGELGYGDVRVIRD